MANLSARPVRTVASRPHVESGTMKTLIAVEDHATRSLLERAITSRLHRVRQAIDFDNALKLCAEERPALVLLDWRLSTSRSPTLLERIRPLRDGAQLLAFAVLTTGAAHESQAALESRPAHS